MSEQKESDVVPNPEIRWTCDACGCHTNTEIVNPSSCGICGTSRRGKIQTRNTCILFLPIRHELHSESYSERKIRYSFKFCIIV